MSGTFSRAHSFGGTIPGGKLMDLAGATPIGFIDTKSEEILPVLEKWKWLVAKTCD